MDPIGELVAYEQAALAAIAGAGDAAALETVRIEFLGRKHGRLRELQAVLGKVDPAQRPVVGKQFNDAKTKVEAAFEARKQELARPKSVAGGIDITLPGTPVALGRKHPLIQTIDDLKEIMGRFGFSVADGPELEDEWHNFEALNVPEDHPARDPLDNFYVATAAAGVGQAGNGKPVLLRSQTSTVQIRVMEHQPPPVRIVCLGLRLSPRHRDRCHPFVHVSPNGRIDGGARGWPWPNSRP